MEIDAFQECAGGVTAAQGFTAGGFIAVFAKQKKILPLCGPHHRRLSPECSR